MFARTEPAARTAPRPDPRDFVRQAQRLVDDHPLFRSLRAVAFDRAVIRRLVRAFDHFVEGLPDVRRWAAERACDPVGWIAAAERAERYDPDGGRHRRYRRFMARCRITPLDHEPRPMAEDWQYELFDLLDDAADDGAVLGVLAAEAWLLGPCLARLFVAIARCFPEGAADDLVAPALDGGPAALVADIERLDPAAAARVMPAFHRALYVWDRYFTRLETWLQLARPMVDRVRPAPLSGGRMCLGCDFDRMAM